MRAFDGFDQEAGLGFAFNDYFAGLTAFKDAFAGIEAQVAERAAGVAGVAVRGEEGPDLRFEEFVAVGGEERDGAGDERHEWAWHMAFILYQEKFLPRGVLCVIIHM